MRTPSLLVLHDGAPQVYLAVDAIPRVSGRAQMLKAFACVHAARAIRLQGVVGIMRRLGATDDCPGALNPASRSQRLTGMPRLPAERLQSRVVPLPDAVGDDGGNRKFGLGSKL